MIELLGFLVIGLSAGILSGLFGIGGGVIIIPSLIYFYGMSQHDAQGTSLGALLLPVGLLGFLEYYRNGHVHLKGAILIAVGLFLGAYFGALVANRIPSGTLSKLFAVFLIFVAVRLFFKS